MIHKKLLVCFLLFSMSFFAQQKDMWTLVSKERTNNLEKVFRKTEPSKATFYRLDLQGLQQLLATAPKRSEINKQGISVMFPQADGKLHQFEVKEAPVLADKLQAKYPNLRSYVGQDVNYPSSIIRFSITTQGLHTMTLSSNKGTQYMDPYTKQGNYYVVYAKKDLPVLSTPFECGVTETLSKDQQYDNFDLTAARAVDDGFLRTFRLALACTVEYAAYHVNLAGLNGGTLQQKKQAVLAAMVVSVTRVTGIYEKDLSVRLVLINNNEDIIFINSDNFTNNNASALIGESQTVIDNIIGDADYDIGHTASTGAGGLASLQVPCVSGRKGRGVTGTSNPIGDAYDVDFLSHEMGHQFGAPHTFNGDAGNCGGNRSASDAYEVGSGTTIMAYAGICSPQNVQWHSDAYFHQKSIRRIWANLTIGNSTCGAQTPNNNSAPVADAGSDYTIPKLTPYKLTGDSADADGTASHTYTWEEYDLGPAGLPAETNAAGPLVRSYEGTTNPVRVVPKMSDLVNSNGSTTWEKLPGVARTMDFVLTVRDNTLFGGQSDDDEMTITVEDVTPFSVTAPNTNVNWNVGEEQTVTWVVGQTANATINCQKVNIKLSTDGGLTYPIMLACNTANDGSEPVVVPNNVSTNCRIMVEAADNIFFDISNANFTIANPAPTFILQRSDLCTPVRVCQNASVSVDFDFTTISGFSDNTTFSVSNLPGASTSSFSTSSLSANGNTTLTLDNFNAVAPGNYTISITGTSASATHTINIPITVVASALTTSSLVAPATGTTDVVLTPNLSWSSVASATSYEVQIATDAAFTNIVYTGVSTTNSHTVAQGLATSTQFYWRVKAINDCSQGAFSNVFNFTTVSCTLCTASSTTPWNTSITQVTINTIDNASAIDGADSTTGYSDFTAMSTDVNRDQAYQLTVKVNTDGSYRTQTKVWIDWNHNCIFDKPSEEYDLGNAINETSGATSNSPLSITVPANASLGSTIMRVATVYSSPTAPYTYPVDCGQNTDGEVEDYTLVVNAPLSVKDNDFALFNVYPNPSNGNVNITLGSNKDVQVSLFDIRGRKVYSNEFANNSATFTKTLNFNAMASGVYMLTVQSGNKKATKKLVIQ